MEFKERTDGTLPLKAEKTSEITERLLNSVVHPERTAPSLADERTFFHDLLNMASIVDGFTTIIEEAETLAETREFAANARRAARILTDTVSHYRLMRDAETGNLRANILPVNVSGLAVELAGFAEVLNRPLGKRLVLECPVGLAMETDAVLLRRVLLNMLFNAFEATPSGGQVRFAVAPAAGMVVFSVANSALIPEETRAHLFQPDNSRRGYGHGLGLYSIKLLGEKYLGGRIACQSEPGTGTVFTAEFPVRAFLSSCA